VATAATRKRPQDATGRQAEDLASAHQAELEERAKEMAMITSNAADDLQNKVVDYSQGGIDITPVPDDDVQVAEVVEVKEAFKTMRVNTKLDMVTFGHRNHYNFEVGPTYKVPEPLYRTLDEKGYVWH
jgi:hypothetical protein